jgi:hypothetical protein
MDFGVVAELPRSRPLAASRRGVLAGLTGGLGALALAALRLAEAESKRNDKRGRKQRRKRKKQQSQQPSSAALSPATRTDAACAGAGTTGLGSTDGNTRLAQTFTALSSGVLVRAELPLIKLLGTDGEYILRLSSVDDSGIPTNEVLAASAVSNLSVPDGPSIVSFAFASPPLVVAGVEYALVLTRPGSTHLQWEGDFDVSCPGGAFVSTDQTAPFVPPGSGVDLLFTTLVSG